MHERPGIDESGPDALGWRSDHPRRPVRTWHAVILAPSDLAGAITSPRMPPRGPRFAWHRAAWEPADGMDLAPFSPERFAVPVEG